MYIFSMVIFPLLLIQEGQLSVTGKSMGTLSTGYPLRRSKLAQE